MSSTTSSRILTYKRTHIGDPDANGIFGINMCMGRVRDYGYYAVIGVGGIGSEPKREGISGKINWVGIGPTHHSAPGKRGSEVTFDHFLHLEDTGPPLEALAPGLAKRLYQGRARFLLDGYSPAERREAIAILEWSKHQTSSTKVGNSESRCQSSCMPKKSKKSCGC